MSLPASLHSAEAQERLLSLRECVEIAIEDNLQLQVQSYNPRLALLFADSQIGGLYDPVFSLNYGDRKLENCLLYTSPSPRDKRQSRMPSSA